MISTIAQETLRIPLENGGSLAAELLYPESDQPITATLLCNPHPYMGGNMQNPIITALAHTLAEAGGLVLRFDYSGVGQSTGASISVAKSMAAFWATGNAPLDPICLANARVAAQHLAGLTTLPISLAGYSFGAFVASQIATPTTPAVALIAPTLRQHTLLRGSRDTQWLTVYSDNDFATPMSLTEQWLSTLTPCSRTLCIPGADHFFRGQESLVAKTCNNHINSTESYL